MDRQEIIDEIKRTAALNGDAPLGREKFAKETGIKAHEWFGIHWAHWGEALKEAGYEPNQFNQAHDSDWLLRCFAEILREAGEWPSDGRLKLICRGNSNLPSLSTLRKRLGRKNEIAAKVIQYCEEQGGWEDVIQLCLPRVVEEQPTEQADEEDSSFGFVYLMKFDKYHKIGHSNAVGRREYELGTKLPEELTTIHSIKTDDPAGVERYWHDRFADKRQEGEWFKLTAADVRAFKKWKRIF